MRVYYGWIIVAAALLMRRPPEMPDQREQVAMAPDVATGGAADPGMTAGQALRSAQFWVLALTYFCCCATHSGPIFHTVSYAIDCGLPVMAAVTIYSVEGLAGLGAATLLSCAGMALGPPVGSWIYDTTDSYGRLYIASFGIGIGAALIALLFPPFPSRRAAALERQSPA